MQMNNELIEAASHVRAMRQALELLAVATFYSPELQARRTEVINAGLSAIHEWEAAEKQEPVQGLDVYLDPADMKPKRYTPAAPVQWVGLTTADLDEIDAPIRERGSATIAEIYRAIEAKLRAVNGFSCDATEKNGGAA